MWFLSMDTTLSTCIAIKKEVVAWHFTLRKAYPTIIPEYSIIDDDYESLTVTCRTFTVTILYRPPAGSVVRFFDYYEKLSQHLLSYNVPVAILGDFNINMLGSDTSSRDFSELIYTSGFTNVIDLPTCVTSSSETLIDLCLMRTCDEVTPAGVFATGISDHMPFFCFVPARITHRSENLSSSFRWISDDSIALFCSIISSATWDDVLESESPNKAYNVFLAIVQEAYCTAFPIRSVHRCRRSRKPWITRALVEQINNRNKLFNVFIQTKNILVLEEFKKVRNKLNAELKRARANYYINKFSAAYYSPQKTWALMKSIDPHKSRVDPHELAFDGTIFRGVSLANKFNDHFLISGASQKVHGNLPLSTYEEKRPNSVFLAPSTPHEIETVIKSLKDACASGSDDTAIRPVKAVSDILSIPLAHICSLILNHGVFPDKMKIARVRAIHKGGARNILGNYRPISILTVFFKDS